MTLPESWAEQQAPGPRGAEQQAPGGVGIRGPAVWGPSRPREATQSAACPPGPRGPDGHDQDVTRASSCAGTSGDLERRAGSVRVLAAVVLEDEADRREQDEQHPD